MAFDFTPLYRSTIGFDGMTALLAHALERDDGAFPPYNIEKSSDDTYRVVVALAGWTRDEIELVTEANRLVVRGHAKKVGDEKAYLHRGIAQRAFERIFDLADHVRREHGRRAACCRPQTRDSRGAEAASHRDHVVGERQPRRLGHQATGEIRSVTCERCAMGVRAAAPALRQDFWNTTAHSRAV
jgi:HSP20 family molecular chaperone IbpA